MEDSEDDGKEKYPGGEAANRDTDREGEELRASEESDSSTHSEDGSAAAPYKIIDSDMPDMPILWAG